MNFPQFSGDLLLSRYSLATCNNFISVRPFTFYPVMRPFYSHEPPPWLEGSGWSSPAMCEEIFAGES